MSDHDPIPYSLTPAAGRALARPPWAPYLTELAILVGALALIATALAMFGAPLWVRLVLAVVGGTVGLVSLLRRDTGRHGSTRVDDDGRGWRDISPGG